MENVKIQNNILNSKNKRLNEGIVDNIQEFLTSCDYTIIGDEGILKRVRRNQQEEITDFYLDDDEIFNNEFEEKITKLFKKNNSIDELKVLIYTGQAYTAQEISNILKSSPSYIENVKGEIKNKILDNFAEFKDFRGEKTIVILREFYLRHKFCLGDE